MNNIGSIVLQIPELRRQILRWLPSCDLEDWKREYLFPECAGMELVRREKYFDLSNDSQIQRYLDQPGPYHKHLRFRNQPHNVTQAMIELFTTVGPTTKTMDLDIGVLDSQPSNVWLYKAIGDYFPRLNSLKVAMHPLIYRNFWYTNESIISPIPSISNLEISFWDIPTGDSPDPSTLNQIARRLLEICPNVRTIQLLRCLQPFIQQLVTFYPRLPNLTALGLEVDVDDGDDIPTIASLFTNLEFVNYPLTKLHLTMFKDDGAFTTFEKILIRFSATMEDIQLLGILMIDPDVVVNECLWPAMPNLVRLGFCDDVTSSECCGINAPNFSVPWCKFVFTQAAATFPKLRSLTVMSKYHNPVVRVSSSIKLLGLLSPLGSSLETVTMISMQLLGTDESELICRPKCSTCNCWSNERAAIEVNKLFPNSEVVNGDESYLLRHSFPMYGYGYTRMW